MSRKRSRRYPAPALEHLRRLASMSQQELADKAGKSAEYVAELERGRRRATLPALRRLACAVGVTPAELLSATPEREAG